MQELQTDALHGRLMICTGLDSFIVQATHNACDKLSGLDRLVFRKELGEELRQTHIISKVRMLEGTMPQDAQRKTDKLQHLTERRQCYTHMKQSLKNPPVGILLRGAHRLRSSELLTGA